MGTTKKEISILIRARNALSAGLNSAWKGLKSFGGSVVSIGKKMGAAFLGFGAAVGFAMKKAEEFNQQLAQISTLSNMSVRDAGKMVRGLSSEFGFGKEEIAKGMYDALSASVPQDQLDSFMRTAIQGASAGASSVAEAVDMLTTSLNAYGLEAKYAGAISDSIFTTIRLGKTTMSELAASFAMVAPLAASSGVAFNQVMAALATLTRQGVKTPVAITQIRAAIIAMNRVLGDGWTATYTLQEGMSEMVRIAGGSANELKKLTGRIEGANGIMAMTGSNAAQAAKDLNAMAGSAGAAAAAFEKTKGERAMSKLGEALKNVALNAGDAALRLLAPLLERAAAAASKFAEKIGDMIDTEKFRQVRTILEETVEALLAGGDSRAKVLTAMGDVVVNAFRAGAEAAINILKSGAVAAGKLMGKAASFASKNILRAAPQKGSPEWEQAAKEVGWDSSRGLLRAGYLDDGTAYYKEASTAEANAKIFDQVQANRKKQRDQEFAELMGFTPSTSAGNALADSIQNYATLTGNLAAARKAAAAATEDEADAEEDLNAALNKNKSTATAAASAREDLEAEVHLLREKAENLKGAAEAAEENADALQKNYRMSREERKAARQAEKALTRENARIQRAREAQQQGLTGGWIDKALQLDEARKMAENLRAQAGEAEFEAARKEAEYAAAMSAIAANTSSMAEELSDLNSNLVGG